MKYRASQLTKWLADIEECELGLNITFSSIVSISTDSSAGISNLVRNLNLKKEEILSANGLHGSGRFREVVVQNQF